MGGGVVEELHSRRRFQKLLLESLLRAMKGDFDIGRCYSEAGGRLGGGKTLDFAKYIDGAVGTRKFPDGLFEKSFHFCQVEGFGGGRFGRFLFLKTCALRGRLGLEAPFPADEHEALVDHDAREPGREGGGAFEAIQVPERLYVGILHGILDLRVIVQIGHADPVELWIVASDDDAKHPVVSTEDTVYGGKIGDVRMVLQGFGILGGGSHGSDWMQSHVRWLQHFTNPADPFDTANRSSGALCGRRMDKR